MALHEIIQVGALQANEMHSFEVDGQRFLLVFSQGDYFVVDEMCSHEDYSLALGCIQDGKIKCSLHGSFFDLVSGEPLVDPADEPINSYQVKIVDEMVCFDPQQKRC